MIRSSANRFASLAIRKGQFLIRPAKKAYKTYQQSAPKATYNAWVTGNESRCYVSGNLRKKPLISIVVPAYNTEPSHFQAMLYSVVNQHYEDWELIIVNASDEKQAKQFIDRASDIDTRVKIVTPGSNLGIAGNTNEGIKQVAGEYVVFLDHDDLLHVCALHSVAAAAEATGAGLIYSDEDKVTDDSSLFFEPFFKPKWSPDLLENVNYINHLTAVRTDHLKQVDGLRSECDGAQDYDFLLRVIDECEPRIEHIPRILYHWRAARSSTANDFSSKQYVLKAGERALRDHLDRKGAKGSAKAIPNLPGFYKTLPDPPKRLSVVVGPVDAANRRLCAVWLKEFTKHIDQGITTELVIGRWYEKHETKAGFTGVHYVDDGPAYWKETAAAASHETVLCLTLAALPTGKEAVSELIARASGGDAIVAPFIVEQGTILDAGLVESDYGKQRLFAGCELGENTYYGYTGFVRNVAGLTLDVFATQKDIFAQLVDGKRRTKLNDSDIKKVKQDGLRLVVNPRAAFEHKGSLLDPGSSGDQYFNPNLTQSYADIFVRVPAWNNLKDESERAND